jgi:tRNA pseudouridine55 synthase
MQHGFLLIDKPVDWTSHDVVGYLRKSLGIKKIGHAGTLDPFATGLLIVGVGRDATKRLDEFKNLPKTYVATIKLGATSDTQDSTGKIEIQETRNKQITRGQIQNVLKKFIGKQTQIPPMHSAKKVGGKKLYELARKGIEIERAPHEIEIFDIELLAYDFPFLTINVRCSAGTYIRTLAHNIGRTLGVGAYCQELERTAIGPYTLKDACAPQEISMETYPERVLPAPG